MIIIHPFSYIKASHMQLLHHNASRPTEAQRPAREGIEAASRQTELGEKTQMSPSGPRPIRPEADRVILTFSFYPNLEPSPQNLHRGEASEPPKSVSRTTQASAGRWVKEQWNAT